MNNVKILAPVIILALVVGFFIGRLSVGNNFGAGSTPPDVMGVYYTTSSDHAIRDGYGTQLRVDQYGRLIVTSTP
jgi:hypothetical protein